MRFMLGSGTELIGRFRLFPSVRYCVLPGVVRCINLVTPDLLAFLDIHNPHIVAIQETNIDSSIATSELFPETCPYNIFRKDRNLHGGGVMLLIHKDIPHMPLSELENDSKSVWVKVFANKTSHYVASWY